MSEREHYRRRDRRQAKNDKKTKMPIMFKQKSRAWLDKLDAYCGDNKALRNALI